MKQRTYGKVITRVLLLISFLGVFAPVTAVLALDEFPQRNVWTQITPSVVWCNDPASTVTIEVHIVGRSDVARVWVTNLKGGSGEEMQSELLDDATGGDRVAGDQVFTISNAGLPCSSRDLEPYGWGRWLGFLRIQLADGTLTGNDYGLMAGLVDTRYKDAFPVQDFGGGLTASAYAFFITDEAHEVMDGYPVATVYCGKGNYEAYRKLYSVFPDVFDIALVTPGMQTFRPEDLAENVPYNVLVSNAVENIGMSIQDDSAAFGSAGRLKSAIYQSFASIQVFDHELGHTWGAYLGESLGLSSYSHWESMTDIEGQMGSYYFEGSLVGHFSYIGDSTWRLVANTTNEVYSPLELYMMGMIPPEDVPDVHILQSPLMLDPEAITAAAYRTVTMEQIIAAEGGERIPAAAESQKDFKLAFIVTQDLPYDDAAIAFFSLQAYNLMTRQPPEEWDMFVPFYYGTGGRGTLDVSLPVDLVEPTGLYGMPTVTPAPADTIVPTSQAIEETPQESGEQDAPGGFSCTAVPLMVGAVVVGLSSRRRQALLKKD